MWSLGTKLESSGYLGGFLWYIGSVRLVEVVRVVEVIGVAELIGEVQGG